MAQSEPIKSFLLRVEQYSTKVGTTEVGTLTFPCMPATFSEVSLKVEEHFHIPVAVQTLFYQNSEMTRDFTPKSQYMRSGDTLRVLYPAKSHTAKVHQAVVWLQEVTQILEQLKGSTKEETALALTGQYYSTFSQDLLTDLFSPWSNPSSEMNAVQFTSQGGVELLTKFHREIIDIRKFKFHNRLENVLSNLEFMCCSTCTSFSMNKTCASLLTRCGGLDNCIDTFLLKPADDVSMLINSTHTGIEISLCAILNISEIPEVQLTLSERNDIMKQALLASSKHWFFTNTPVMTVSLLLCMSRCQKAHVNLLKPDLVNEINKLCATPGIIISSNEFDALKLP